MITDAPFGINRNTNFLTIQCHFDKKLTCFEENIVNLSKKIYKIQAVALTNCAEFYYTGNVKRCRKFVRKGRNNE